MEENANVMANENVAVTVTGPAEVLLPENNSKPAGLTTGQKAIGGSVIGLAIVGIVSLIMWAVNGIKGLIVKAKAKKAQVAAPADPAPTPAAPQENAVDTQASETPETK